MKKLMLLAGLYCLQPALYASSWVNPGINNISNEVLPVNASDRAKAHFNANYSEAQDATWYTLPNKDMYCLFHTKKIANRVFYNSHGNWQYTLIGYPGSALSSEIKEQVANEYDGYKITWVTEIRSNQNKPVYVLNIENTNHIRVIKLAGDDIEEQQVLVKE
jgi:hypothetical protein